MAQGWFIFTTILLICTLKSTVAFFMLFFTLDLAFLCLAISFVQMDAEGNVHPQLTIAGGVFGLLAAFLAWYNALAGLADTSNRYVSMFACVVNISVLGGVHPSSNDFLIERSCILPFCVYSLPTNTYILQLLHHPSRTLSVVREGP